MNDKVWYIARGSAQFPEFWTGRTWTNHRDVDGIKTYGSYDRAHAARSRLKDSEGTVVNWLKVGEVA